MTQYCPVSCNKCDMHEFGYRLSKKVEGGLSIIPFCQDNNIDCRKFAEAGECDSNSQVGRLSYRVRDSIKLLTSMTST